MPLSLSAAARNIEAFRSGLHDLGYFEGRNYTLEFRFAEGFFERLPKLAVELVALKPALIIAGSPPATVGVSLTWEVTVKRRDILLFVFFAAIILAVTAANSLRLSAQDQPGFAGNKVIPLVKADLSGVSNKQVIANIYEVPSGHMVPLHFHHGDEFHLVLSGEWAAQVEGRPDHVMNAGDAQYVEREHWHGGKVISATPLRLLGVMIVDKDKPIIEMKH